MRGQRAHVGVDVDERLDGRVSGEARTPFGAPALGGRGDRGREIAVARSSGVTAAADMGHGRFVRGVGFGEKDAFFDGERGCDVCQE